MTTRMISKVAATLAFLACAGCSAEARTSNVASGAAAVNEPIVYRDSTTGCDYLTTGLYHGLTPRMNASGKQICEVRP